MPKAKVKGAKTLGAFKGDPKIKAAAIQEMEEHKRLDHLARGNYWDPRTNTGCAIGCMAGVKVENPHAFVAGKLGLPEGLLRQVDNLFENIPGGEHVEWPLQFLEAVPVGANLDLVYPKYMLALSTDKTWGLRKLTGEAVPFFRMALQLTCLRFKVRTGHEAPGPAGPSRP